MKANDTGINAVRRLYTYCFIKTVPFMNPDISSKSTFLFGCKDERTCGNKSAHKGGVSMKTIEHFVKMKVLQYNVHQ